MVHFVTIVATCRHPAVPARDPGLLIINRKSRWAANAKNFILGVNRPMHPKQVAIHRTKPKRYNNFRAAISLTSCAMLNYDQSRSGVAQKTFVSSVFFGLSEIFLSGWPSRISRGNRDADRWNKTAEDGNYVDRDCGARLA